MERSKLVVVFKHFVQCKGNFEGCHLLLWLRVFQVLFHNHHEINLYHEDVVEVWTVHGKNKRAFSVTPRPHEGACT